MASTVQRLEKSINRPAIKIKDLRKIFYFNGWAID